MSGNRGGSIRFLCGMCSYSTEDDGAFLTHYSDQHKREMAYWCRECGHTFTSPTLLVAHIKTSCPRVKSVTMRCGVTNCSFSGNDPFQFMQHVKIVHKGVHLFPCFKCRKLFTIPSCLIQHIQTECAESKRSSVDEPTAPRSGGKPAVDNRPKQSSAAGVKEAVTTSVKSNVKSEKRPKESSSWKNKNPFAGSDEDSDPDDPTWKPVIPGTSDKTKGGNKSYECDLQSDIEILYSSSGNKSKKPAKRKDSSLVAESSPSSYKKPKKEERKSTVEEPVMPPQQRFERWSDWWKALSSFKSVSALEQLQQEESLCHFFTCMEYSCQFSTNNDLAFMKHQTREHPCKKLACLYCLREFEAGVTLAEHTVSAHGSRRQQCSRCPYRAATKGQVALHFEAMHGGKPVIYTCDPVGLDGTDITEIAENVETEVAMPYICRVGQCKYETCNPEEFVVHNRALHSGVSVYPCFYCGAETFKLDALMRHYRLHGIYNFQCAHCVHGTNTIEEILCHQCLNHAERRMQVYVRPSSSSTKSEPHPDGSSLEPEAPDVYPNFHSNYTGNFSCGVEKCLHTLDGLESYQEHLQVSHHCSSFFPCPHCTEISITSTNLEEHLAMHGPTLYSCSARGCSFFHWDKGVAVAHCWEKHSGTSAKVVIVREIVGGEFKSKRVPEIKTDDYKPSPVRIKAESGVEEVDNQDNRINFQLQLLGSISLQSSLPQSLSLDESKCTFGSAGGGGGEVPEETLKTAPSMHKSDVTADDTVKVKIEDFGNRMRACFFCGFSSMEQDTFRAHLYKELNYKPFYCDICSFAHASRDGVLQHVLSRHPNALESTCKERRNEVFDSWVSLYIEGGPGDLHLKPDQSGRACVVCGIAIASTDSESYKQHLCDHLRYRPHSCLSCKDTFFSQEEARAHAVGRHRAVGNFFTSAPIERIEEWITEQTEKSFTRQEKPFTRADGSKGRGCYRHYYKCYYCDFGPSILSVQVEHCSEKHAGRKLRLKSIQRAKSSATSEKPCPSPEKPKYSVPPAFLCPHCGQNRPSKKSLDFHKSICNGSTSRPSNRVSVRNEKDTETSKAVDQKSRRMSNKSPEESSHGSRKASEEGFSFYRKKSHPLNLSKICVVPPQSLSVKIPVEDYMKILNFNVGLSLVDLRKTFSRRF